MQPSHVRGCAIIVWLIFLGTGRVLIDVHDTIHWPRFDTIDWPFDGLLSATPGVLKMRSRRRVNAQTPGRFIDLETLSQ